jgi:hypothetical protein
MNLIWTPEGWEVKDIAENYVGDIYPSNISGFNAVKITGETKNFPTFQDAQGFFRELN